MPDPGFQWDWFLLNYIFWLPIIAIWWIVKKIRELRRRDNAKRNDVEQPSAFDE